MEQHHDIDISSFETGWTIWQYANLKIYKLNFISNSFGFCIWSNQNGFVEIVQITVINDNSKSPKVTSALANEQAIVWYSRLYKRSCPSVCRSVSRLVCRSYMLSLKSPKIDGFMIILYFPDPFVHQNIHFSIQTFIFSSKHSFLHQNMYFFNHPFIQSLPSECLFQLGLPGLFHEEQEMTMKRRGNERAGDHTD